MIDAFVKSGATNQWVFFEAPPGLTGFTAYRIRNEGSATVFASLEVGEIDSTNMPGIYRIKCDEDTTISAAYTTQMMSIYVSATGWTGKALHVCLYDNLPADLNQVLGTDIAEGAADNDRNIGY